MVNHEDIVVYFVHNHCPSAAQVAKHFGIHKRTAEKHLREIRMKTE